MDAGEWTMSELDYGAHRKCYWCDKLQPEKRMLHYDNRWYCGIQHYLLQLNLKPERSEDDSVAPVDDKSLDI